MSYNPSYQHAKVFAARLARGEPKARHTLHGLVQAHSRGNAAATRALQCIASVVRKEGISIGEHSTMISGTLAPMGKFAGRTFSTAASFLEGTGRLVGKPFRWVSRKLGSTAPFHLPHRPKMLAHHAHVPARR